MMTRSANRLNRLAKSLNLAGFVRFSPSRQNGARYLLIIQKLRIPLGHKAEDARRALKRIAVTGL